MANPFATVNGQRVIGARISVPNVGSWFADLDLEAKSDLTGKVEVVIGTLKLLGTVAPAFSGSFALASKVRVVAGAGAWSKNVPAKAYHNDVGGPSGEPVGVKQSTVLADLAREIGETILDPPKDRVGTDFVRRAGPASRVLAQVIGASPWWVDYEGVTHIGSRHTAEVTSIRYELLEFEPRAKVATLAVDDPSIISIGSILRARLDEPVTVRELEVVLDAGKFRLLAWCGGDSSAHSRIGRGLRAIARETSARHDLMGLYRFRVVFMSGDRAQLQAVRKAAGLPDILPVSLFPGMAGLWADLTPGTTVLVSFIEGDAAAPIVTHYEPKGGEGFRPVSLLLDATDLVDVGPSASHVKLGGGSLGGGSLGVARLGDTVQAGPFTGTITSASTKVTAG